MRKFTISLLLIATAIFSLVFIGCQGDVEKSPIIVKIGKDVFTLNDLRQSLPVEMKEVTTKDDVLELVNRWINNEIMYQEGIRIGLGENAEIEKRIENFRKTLIATSYIDAYIDSIANDIILFPDSSIQNFYEAHLEDFKRSDDERYLRHILLETKEEADSVRNILNRRTQTFDSLAAQIAEIQGIPKSEWDIGYVSANDIIPTVYTSVDGYRPGRFSRVIETSFGFHIVLLVDTKSAGTIRELDEVRPEIISRLKQDARQETYRRHLSFLKNGAAIETNFQLLDTMPMDSLFLQNNPDQGDEN